MARTPHVTLAHDDALVLDVLAFACASKGIDVLDIVGDYEELRALCDGRRPDVVLVADRIDGVPVEDVLDQLASLDARIIVLSDDTSPDRLGQLLARDISGLLSHDAGPDDVIAAIRAVARGEMALNPSVLTLILQQWRRLRAQPVQFGARRRPMLTPRELDIVAAMTDGLAAKAIAARLGVAVKTVENHKIRVFEKLGVRSQAHAVTVAMAYGLAPAATRLQASDLDVTDPA
ncbi:MAG: response regulator transcription factor [Actinomycetota bacterium]|nr:response regulator transcription factor [Actinomycetota bacterium]